MHREKASPVPKPTAEHRPMPRPSNAKTQPVEPAEVLGNHKNTGQKRPQRCTMNVFVVSKVRLDPVGRITAVLWGEVDTNKNA
jgi:hypothetical protein